MRSHRSGALRSLGIASALTAALALAAPTLAAGHSGALLRARRDMLHRLGALRSTGQITDVLSSSEFVLALSDENALAVNVTSATTVVNDMTTPPTTSAGGAALATGEYAIVTYRFDPSQGAVASRIVLTASPPPTGPIRTVRGMVTGAGTGAFTLENANGVSFTIDILPTTRMRWIETGVGAPGASAEATPPLAVGDFATVSMQSAGSANDADQITYSNAPTGIRSRHGEQATVQSVSGNVLTLTLHNSGTLSVTVLPSAIVELNGQMVTVGQLAAGDSVRLRDVRFDGVYYATSVIAASPAGA